jgi:pimeloyl-ACP methyl ester carboxylesterase
LAPQAPVQLETVVAKASKLIESPNGVRTRRAYFDCQFGQLHVRTAFPTTGGFDELVTLICLHPSDASSRAFSRFLPEIADVRSVYAPDLPGYGESDSSPTQSIADAAVAVSDLANDLRLRQIDVLGFHYGAGVALALAAARPELVRRLVLAAVPTGEALPVVAHKRLLLEVASHGDRPFETAAATLARQVGQFLSSQL